MSAPESPPPAVGLRKFDLDTNPFIQFDRWFQQAVAANLKEPTAMTLATATQDGRPSARTVLLKKFDEQGFVFFTNYESQKGKDLAENGQAALLFYWDVLERQVRITGLVTTTSREESEAYFRTRPLLSKVGALASRQSQVLKNRDELDQKVERLLAEYREKEVPLPPSWGGYRVTPELFEFWQARPNRLHDRFRYSRVASGEWRIDLLSP